VSNYRKVKKQGDLMEEFTKSNSQALMNLEISAQTALKERERLQVEIVKLNTEKLLGDFQTRLQKELYSMQSSIESLQRENEQLRSELQKERENSKSFQKKTIEAVNKDRMRLKALENRSLWDQIKKIWS
jgi:hypothetical protein